jgi:uncharacterized repeat protein (TIGR03847 family)
MGRADWIGVEALGLPGQRTFRVLVSAGPISAHLWLEKEQLQALTDAVARLLAEIDAEQGASLTAKREEPTALPRPADFPETADIEVYVGALGLRYDPQREMVALEVYERDAAENDPPTFRCLGTRKQIESLHISAMEVLASGRPRCPFCGAPLPAPGMPHFCPPTNGHQKLTDEE